MNSEHPETIDGLPYAEWLEKRMEDNRKALAVELPRCSMSFRKMIFGPIPYGMSIIAECDEEDSQDHDIAMKNYWS